jgi:cytidine deaminase
MSVDLIDVAQAKLNPHQAGDRLFGDVAAALETVSGAIHVGVCIDTGSGTGFCAEAAAIASMVTAGEYEIARIVAVWRAPGGSLTVLAPCGRCREFIRQMHPRNLATTVLLSGGREAALRTLLPEWAWPEPERLPAPPTREDTHMQMPKPTDEDKQRFRDLVEPLTAETPDVQVKAMFGQLGAFVHGNMFAGLFGSSVGVKLDDAAAAELAAAGGASFGPEERPMSGYLTIPPGADAGAWIARAADYVAGLPPKASKKR